MSGLVIVSLLLLIAAFPGGTTTLSWDVPTNAGATGPVSSEGSAIWSVTWAWGLIEVVGVVDDVDVTGALAAIAMVDGTAETRVEAEDDVGIAGVTSLMLEGRDSGSIKTSPLFRSFVGPASVSSFAPYPKIDHRFLEELAWLSASLETVEVGLGVGSAVLAAPSAPLACVGEISSPAFWTWPSSTSIALDSSDAVAEGTCSTGVTLATVSWLVTSLLQRIDVRSPCVEEVDPLRSLAEAEGRVCLIMEEGKVADDGREEGREELSRPTSPRVFWRMAVSGPEGAQSILSEVSGLE